MVGNFQIAFCLPTRTKFKEKNLKQINFLVLYMIIIFGQMPDIQR